MNETEKKEENQWEGEKDSENEREREEREEREREKNVSHTFTDIVSCNRTLLFLCLIPLFQSIAFSIRLIDDNLI